MASTVSPPRGRARRPPTPYARIQAAARLPERLKAHLPPRWERLGDVLLLKLPPPLQAHVAEVCRVYAQVLGVHAILEVSQGIDGPWRTPRSTLLWGTETETVHVENGVRFKLDPRKVMFASGNLAERARMARVVRPGEVVVDLFAGIGYFSLPMAVHGAPERIVACEVNPTAYRYLEENIALNHVDTIEPHEGDCRTVAPKGIADRVVLGYLRDTDQYLPTALRCLRQGGWLHYHEACPDARVARLLAGVEAAAAAEGQGVASHRLHRVKPYAPGVSHWVLDVLIEPGGSPPTRSQ